MKYLRLVFACVCTLVQAVWHFKARRTMVKSYTRKAERDSWLNGYRVVIDAVRHGTEPKEMANTLKQLFGEDTDKYPINALGGVYAVREMYIMRALFHRCMGEYSLLHGE